jgi:hypothetical protein
MFRMPRGRYKFDRLDTLKTTGLNKREIYRAHLHRMSEKTQITIMQFGTAGIAIAASAAVYGAAKRTYQNVRANRAARKLDR